MIRPRFFERKDTIFLLKKALNHHKFTIYTVYSFFFLTITYILLYLIARHIRLPTGISHTFKSV